MWHTGDLLGVNELHGGQCRSLVQVAGLYRSYDLTFIKLVRTARMDR